MSDAANRSLLRLLRSDEAPQAVATSPNAPPVGIWDAAAAIGYRRLQAVDRDGDIAVEINMSRRLPPEAQEELRRVLERVFYLAVRAMAFTALSSASWL